MPKKKKDELSVSWPKLGLGTGTLASLGRASSLAEVEKLIGVMVGAGITLIDTADSYGSGDCEILLGKAMKVRRQEFSVVSKAGYRLSNLPGPFRPLNQFIKKAKQRIGCKSCHEPDYLVRCLEDSLRRLRTDHVDAFLLHDPPLEAISQAVIGACEGMRQSGKALLTGISSDNPAVLHAAISSGAFDVIQTPASLEVAAEMRPIWEGCKSAEIHVIANHVFAPGCLTHPEMNHETLMRASVALLPPTATILCGTRNHSHLVEAARWATDPLPEAEAMRLAGLMTQSQQHG